MRGPEFVEILHNLGYEKVATHMAVLDDADQMVLEIRLEAAGFTKTAGGEGDTVEDDKPSPLRKKSPIRKKSASSGPGTGTRDDDARQTRDTDDATSADLPLRKKALPLRDAPGRQAPAASREAPSTEAASESVIPRPQVVEAKGAGPALQREPGDEPTRKVPEAPRVEPTNAPEVVNAGHRPSASPEPRAPKTTSNEGTPQTPAARDVPEPVTAPRDISSRPAAVAQAGSGETKVEAAPEAKRSPGTADAPAQPAEQRQPEQRQPEPRQPEPRRPEPRSPEAATARPPLERTAPVLPAVGDAANEAAQKEQATTASSVPDQKTPAVPTDPTAQVGATGAGETPPAEDPRKIRRLPQPEKKAKILGRIELPASTIRDATRRSAGGPRNPSGVDRNLRQAAMNQFRNRGAQKTPFGLPQRRGPTTPGGPGGQGGPRFGGAGGGRRGGRRPSDPLAPPPGIDPDKLVQVEAPVSVKKLSEALGHKVNQILLVLMRLGVPANINSYLDKDQVELLALELSRNVEVVEETGAEDALVQQLAEDKESTTAEDMQVRPPIVTFMGHVDHGKTTLIDALRGSSITKGEAGGITQHVGAYRVSRAGHELVILDTPGHAAFTSMRARGAQLTDVVVLVVAADDGVMPQTEEALNHARAADAPLLIAVNKCDKPDANPMLVRQQLAAKGVQPEEWGGNVQFVDVSALTGKGLDDLAEKIALEAEILELKANPDHLASGIVIEAKQTPAQGNVISLMVLDGTLERGDLVLCGSGTGRIRVLLDDRGNPIDKAPPGTPVEVLGLPELPHPGDKFFEVKDTKMAKEVALQRASKQRNLALAEKSKSRTMDLKAQFAAKKRSEVKLIIKADVMGSLEPIRQSLEDLSNDEVAIRILHAALGGITETDVALADASEAIIVGFNSVPDEKARHQAEASGVTIRFYNIIYELIDDAKKLLEGLLSPEEKEEVRGHAEIRRIFRSSKLGNIAGCYVLDGTIGRNNRARLVRDGKVIYSGKIKSLRRDKDDTREVRTNFECGILLQNYDDLKEGDIIEAYEIIELQRTLGDS